MTKKNESGRNSDILMMSVNAIIQFFKGHKKESVVGLIILLIAIATGFAYAFHRQNQYDAIQYQLSVAITAFDSYNAKGDKSSLDNAEKLLKAVVKKKERHSQYVAELYLAKLSYMRGDIQTAIKSYQGIAKSSAEAAIKSLAEDAVSHLQKKP